MLKTVHLGQTTKRFAKPALAGSLVRALGSGVNGLCARRVRLPVFVEKPQPNYLRDGVFIVITLLAVLLFELFSGTGAKVRTYSVPKEKPAATAARPDSSSLIQFTKPEGWTEDTDTSGLATLSFALPGKVGVSAIPLPARLAENPMIINMWREQVGLGPVDDAAAQGLAKPIAIGGHTGRLFDFAGTKPLAGQEVPPRIVSASLVLGQVGWFFKLSGSADAIGPQFGAFTNFLATLKFQPAASEVNFDKLMSEAQETAKQPPPPEPAADGPTWARPAGWTEKPRTAMRLGNFTAGDGQAEITVMTFPGDVGGLLANVNRWRGLAGLSPVDATGLAKATVSLSIAGTPATLVEAIGEKKGSMSVYHQVGDQTWFYKIAGPSAVVAAEKTAFMEFIQSIQFPKP